MTDQTPDPTPSEIAAACLEIQSTWTAEEKLRRLRVDLRPCFTLVDGRQQGMDATTYNAHHDAREAMAGANGSRPVGSIDCDHEQPNDAHTQFAALR